MNENELDILRAALVVAKDWQEPDLVSAIELVIEYQPTEKPND